MSQHSVGKTVKYKFECDKSIHLKVSKEKDGTLDFRVMGEKNGSCSGCVLEFTMNLLNRGMKGILTADVIRDEAKSFICPINSIKSRSCIDTLSKDITAIIEAK